MKKAFLLASILFISVISTACINNFAVQELNNKAKDFMDKGDYVSAIERLKSSVDLDGSVFETQYNLAVAYTKAEDYQNAVKTYNEVLKLNADYADAYYSLAVCEENLAKDIISGELSVDENGEIRKADNSEVEIDEKADKKALSEEAKTAVKDNLNNALSDYKIYIDKTSENTEDVEEHIKEVQNLLEKYSD